MHFINLRHFPSNKHRELTKQGLDELKAKLDNLRHERFKLCNKLMGMDVQEKTEHILSTDALKMLQINEIEVERIGDILQHSDIVSDSKVHEDVQLGSTVDLQTGDKTVKYTLVDSLEADPIHHKISRESPLGRALLGRKKLEFVKIITPRGRQHQYKVLAIN